MHFFMHFFRKWLSWSWVRTLKIDILTLFISLTLITFICVMCYSFIRNYDAILKYSKGTMERNASIVVERVNNIEEDATQILETSEAIFPIYQQYPISSPQLRLYMLNILKFYPYTASLFFAYPSGNRILVKTMEASVQSHFMTDPQKLLPTNTTYIVKIMDLKHPPEIWYYMDADFKVLASETFAKPTIDVKTRPWWQGALQNPQLYWTPVYAYVHTHEHGITASQAVYDAHHQLVGVIGADASLIGLSRFLTDQKIGKSGRAFIINEDGEVLAPDLKSLDHGKISAQVVEAVIAYHQKTHNHNFSIQVNHVRYLSYITHIPAKFNKKWLIVAIVPFSDFFSDLINVQFQVILITLFILGISILVIIYFSKRISQPIVGLAKEIDKITNLSLDSETRILSHIVEIRMMDTSVASLRAALRSFSRYVPKEIVHQLLAQGREIALHVDKKKLTIFFSDIKDFTTIAETTSLRTLMPLLNNYFDGISKIILQFEGTIDKYIGDSVMAIWGAPVETSEHAILACMAALKCQVFVHEFNQQCRREGKPEFLTRFGISSGTVVVGNIGTLERMNYTVIGDAVNTAARLQVTDKIYHVSIIISEQVYKQTKGRFLVRPLDTVEVKGKKTKIKIYELVALHEDDPEIGPTPQQAELCALFTEAYQEFIAGNYKHAQELFTAIHQKFPEDYPTEFYLERLRGNHIEPTSLPPEQIS